jgi:hypothetical protein
MTIPAHDTATYVTTVTNLTDQPLDLLVTRTQNDLPGSDWSSWFCVGSTCYQPDDITGSMTLTPAQAVPVKLYVQGGAYITGKLVGDVTLSFAGASQSSSQKYTTTVKNSSGVSMAAVAGNGLSIDQNAPNPASGLTRLDYFLPTSGSTSIELFSVTGQKVFSKALSGQEHGNHAAMIDVTTLPNGVYTVVLSSNGARVTRSMTVVH